MTQATNKAVGILTSGNSAAAAAARVAIKRVLIRAGWRVRDYSMWAANRQAVDIFRGEPWRADFIAEIEALIEDSARAWVSGNNSGDSVILASMEREHVRLGDAVDILFAALGVAVDWPGLYPSFTFNGFGYHDVASVMRAVREARGE